MRILIVSFLVAVLFSLSYMPQAEAFFSDVQGISRLTNVQVKNLQNGNIKNKM